MFRIARSIAGLGALSLSAAFAPAYPVLAQNAYYPAAVAEPKTGPTWERPKTTRFSAMRCNAGARMAIDQLTINREDVADTKGIATYTDATRATGYEHGAGGWALTGAELKVQGDGFELQGRWVGPILTAVITRAGSHDQQRCRFQVTTLRSFTQYQ